MATPKSLLKAAARGKGAGLRRLLGMLTMAFALLGISGLAWGAPTITEYEISPSGTIREDQHIVAGPDGNLWFTKAYYKIGKLATDGVFSNSEYYVPSGVNAYDILLGPDNNLWFTIYSEDKIGKLTADGVFTEFSLKEGAKPYALAVGPDGYLWFTEYGADKIGKMTTDGVILAEYVLDNIDPKEILAGPDGNIWFSQYSDSINKMSIDGVISATYELGVAIRFMTKGPDDNIWFTGGKNKIGKITTNGSVTLYTIPDEETPYPNQIVAGPDGNLWFTCLYDRYIGMITTSGVITLYKLASSGSSNTGGITVGPDKNIWFTHYDQIGKVDLDLPLTASGKHLIWQNTSSGEMRWWSLASSAKIISNTTDVGHGKVSNETLTSEWRFAGTTTLDGAKTLFYQNTGTGYVKYWKLDSSGKLSSSGLVSDTLTVKGEWKAVGVKTLNGSPTIIWQNQSSGKVVYWLLTSTGALLSATKNEGWGYVSESLTVNSNWRLSSVTTLGGSNVLLWQNQSNGKIVYWKLDGSNKLINETKDSGWGYVSSLTLASQWRQVGILNSNALIWQGQSYGKIAWWLLGDDARLTSTAKDTGWGYVSDNLTLNSAWTLGAVTELGGDKTFLWHNPSSGRVAFWKVSDAVKLKNETQNNGWGYVSNNLTMSGNWTLNCITD
jgi:virginiamycin B lyase